MENQNTNNFSKKQLYSLACVFLFSPFVGGILKDDEDLSMQDKNFIGGFEKYGNLILMVLGVELGIYLANVFFLKNVGGIDWVLKILTLGVILGLLFGAFRVFQNKPIFVDGKAQEIENITSSIQIHHSTILNYIPGYNYYLWQKEKNYFLKESILFSTLLILASIFYYFGLPKILIIIVFLIWIFRVVTLVGGVDIFSTKIKSFLNSLFSQNPEEIFGYPKAVFSKIFTFFSHQNIDIKNLISAAKLPYQENKYFYSLLEGKKIYDSVLVIEYFLALVLFIIFLRRYYILMRYEIISLLYFLPIILIFVRYSVAYYFKSLPHLPIFYEISKGLVAFLKKFDKPKKVISDQA